VIPASLRIVKRTDTRTARHVPMEIGEVRIGDIEPAPKSRDDMPALLTGLRHPYRNEGTREALSALPDRHVLPGRDRHNGRRSMELRVIPVTGVPRQDHGCGHDRLHGRVNGHRTVRRFPEHSGIPDDVRHPLRTVTDHAGCRFRSCRSRPAV